MVVLFTDLICRYNYEKIAIQILSIFIKKMNKNLKANNYQII